MNAEGVCILLLPLSKPVVAPFYGTVRKTEMISAFALEIHCTHNSGEEKQKRKIVSMTAFTRPKQLTNGAGKIGRE